ncbi:MAG: S8 family peptidase [Bacteroidota bacterium]|nr:S8 family peptidase [Bacteroidota bacterium]
MKFIALFAFFGFTIVYSQDIPLDPLISDYLKKHSKVPVLISLRNQAELVVPVAWTKEEKATFVFNKLSNHTKKSQYELLREMKNRGMETQSFYLINVILTNVSKDDLTWLSHHEQIQSIHFDDQISLQLAHDPTILSLEARSPQITWGLKSIEADVVWNMGYEGQGVTVAGEDTGYKWDVSSLKDRYRGWNGTEADHNYNWHDAIHTVSPLSDSGSTNPCGLNLLEPCDDHGHGTHTAGTMVGQTAEQYIGVAPKAKWIGCRNMERGNGSLASYLECFEFFLAPTDLNGNNPKPELAPHVINNSWYCSREEGCNSFNFQLMNQIVINLKNAGIVVVVSAGNEGNSCGSIRNPPAFFEASFTVGSYAINDSISNFSSCGPVLVDSSLRIKPNVVAPGSDVVSQLPDGSFQGWYGTSMAGPHVAGLVALIISAKPSLAGQVEKIETIIEESSKFQESHLDCTGFNNAARPNHMYGYGMIRAKAAIEMALSNNGEENDLHNDVKIWPNPGNEKLYIQSKQADGRLIIYNYLGIKIMETKYSNGELEFNGKNWPSGYYVILDVETNRSFSWIKK